MNPPTRAHAAEMAERRYAILPLLQWSDFSQLLGEGVPASALI
jgi:hypothetical protein